MMSESERRLRSQIAAHASWAKTEDRSARTAKARAAMMQRFLDEAGGDPVAAEHLRRAHYMRLSLKSAEARRKAKEQQTEVAPRRRRKTEEQAEIAEVDAAELERARELFDDL